ncbi:MAG TPA: hypothetical protein VGJ02_02090 [Pyrinomonadaceae bacterium]
MGNTQPNNTETVKIQGLLGGYLKLRSRRTDRDAVLAHLDEDTLTAFTEGTLSEREALPVVSHLTDCSFCRHKTVEIVRLELQFADMDAPAQVRETSEPASVANVLNGILSRIFGSSEAAVFAHEEPEKNEEEKKEEENTEE